MQRSFYRSDHKGFIPAHNVRLAAGKINLIDDVLGGAGHYGAAVPKY